MKKKLNTSSLQNELEGGSAFFRPSPEPAKPKQASPTPSPKEKAKPKAKTERFSVRKSVRSEKRTANRSGPFPYKRSSKRYSFEFYTDQLATLNKLEGQAMMSGKGFNKSDFVRRALDEYFEKVGVELVEPQ